MCTCERCLRAQADSSYDKPCLHDYGARLRDGERVPGVPWEAIYNAPYRPTLRERFWNLYDAVLLRFERRMGWY